MNIWKGIRPYISGLIRFVHISYIEAKASQSGTHLGLIWIPLSSLIFAAMLTLVFRHSDTMSLENFFLYVLAGYVFWIFISDSITGSTDVIQSRLDFAIHNNLSLFGLFGKLLVDRLLTFSLNLIALFLLVILFSPANLGPGLGLMIPFVALIVVTSLSAAYLVNILTVHFPDLKTMLRVGTRFMFFVSPVFWSAADTVSGPRAFLVQYNPIAYYLSLPRQIFGIEPFEPNAWLIATIFSAAISMAGYFAYHRSHAFVRNLR